MAEHAVAAADAAAVVAAAAAAAGQLLCEADGGGVQHSANHPWACRYPGP